MTKEQARTNAQGTYRMTSMGVTVAHAFSNLETGASITNIAYPGTDLVALEKDFIEKASKGFVPVFFYYITEKSGKFIEQSDPILFERIEATRRVTGLTVAKPASPDVRQQLRSMAEAVYEMEVYPRLEDVETY